MLVFSPCKLINHLLAEAPSPVITKTLNPIFSSLSIAFQMIKKSASPVTDLIESWHKGI